MRAAQVTPLSQHLKTSDVSDQKIGNEPVSQILTDNNDGNKKLRLFTSTKELINIMTPNVISSSKFLGFIWAVLYVFFLGVFGAQTWEMMSDFASHPVTVSISIRSDTFSAQFPTVTLCNNNIARASMLQRVSRYEELVFLDGYIANSLELSYNSPDVKKSESVSEDEENGENESNEENARNGSRSSENNGNNSGKGRQIAPDDVTVTQSITTTTSGSINRVAGRNEGGSDGEDPSSPSPLGLGTTGGGKQGRSKRGISCPDKLFQCASNLCIPQGWVCNGRSECGDDSDEEPNQNCTGKDDNALAAACTQDYLQCPGELTCAIECDGVRECVVVSGYDERESPKCPDSCIRTINVTDSLEYLTSPGYPEDYPMKLQCEYYLIAPEGEHVELKFEHFKVEEQTHCQFDYMKIRDGGSKTDPWFIIKDDNVFTCGTLENGLTIYSTSNLLKIYFNSDSIKSASGWNVSYRAIQSRSKRASDIISRSKRADVDFDGSSNRSNSDVSFYSPNANYNDRDQFDWYGAFVESVMPDFSDFKQLLNLEADEIIGNGHQVQDFIIQCVFDGMLCSHRHFKTIQTKQGSCDDFFKKNALLFI